MGGEAQHLLVAFQVGLHMLEAAAAHQVDVLEALALVQQRLLGLHASHAEADGVGLGRGLLVQPGPTQHVGSRASQDARQPRLGQTQGAQLVLHGGPRSA
ncbi:MAG: hypothetical protein IPG77_00935 [Betaproteobacteria bacterium]|nr:hypothetical protein [Betaproteobacteria bacterium]